MRLHHLARVSVIVPDIEAAITEYCDGFSNAQITNFDMPEARALALGAAAIAGARAAYIAQSVSAVGLELIEQPNAQPALEHLGWAGFDFHGNSTSVRVNCLNCAVSAAFYSGLGADDVRQIDAQTRVIQLNNSALRFASGKAELPAMDIANLSLGILSVQLARLGSRGQAGPVRVLRGPDAELIELV